MTRLSALWWRVAYRCGCVSEAHEYTRLGALDLAGAQGGGMCISGNAARHVPLSARPAYPNSARRRAIA